MKKTPSCVKGQAEVEAEAVAEVADVKAGPRGRCLKLAQEADELIDKSYGHLKAASLVKVLRALYFTCECEYKCSALLIH